MKRVLSLILVLVLALGSVPFAFAADMSAGQELKELGLVKGDQNGDLNEGSMLTRAEMMVMLSRLLGVEEDAKNYAIPSTSKDVEGHWAAKYIAYAEQVGQWTSGVGANMFDPEGKVTTQMVAKFMLTALGHEANWDTAVADATALGLLEGVDADATANVKRSDVFTASLNTINTPKKGSEVSLGVELGILTEEVNPATMLEDAVIDNVKAVGNTLVEITFEDDVDAEAAANVANYGITEKANTSNVIVISNVVVDDTDRITLETAALDLGVAYTLTFDEKSINFSGLDENKDAPELDSVRGFDTGMVKVIFDEALIDTATAEDIANYEIDKEGTVVKAELQEDRKTVELTVEGFTSTTAKRLTVKNVLSVDKVAMKSTTKVFFPSYDKFAPKFSIDESASARINNIKVTIKVNDIHGIDEATAEDIANYSIEGLSVIKAEAEDSDEDDDDDYLDRIVLTTSEQTNGKAYTLKINNLIDGSNAKNAMTKEYSENFRGSAADKKAPAVKDVDAKTTTEIRVEFTEKNLLDPTTALNPANYELDKTDFQILEANFLDGDDEEKIIVLTTSTQPSDRANFKLTVSNVTDEFNNTMDEVTKFFTSAVEDTEKPVIEGLTTSTTDEIVLEFANDVDEDIATDPTNYVVDESIGSPLKAELDGKKVTLTFDELKGGKTYTLTVRNITNLYDIVMDEKEIEFIAVREEADTTLPEIDSYFVTNKYELRITFDEEVTAAASSKVLMKIEGTTTVVEAAYKARLEDESTLVYEIEKESITKPYVGKDLLITDVTGVKDEAANAYVYPVATTEVEDSDRLEVSDAGEGDLEEPELLSWAQEDLRTFILYFDREVAEPTTGEEVYTFSTEAKADAYAGGTSSDSYKTFDIERDEDDFTILRMEMNNALDEEFEAWINFEYEVTDLVGVMAQDYAFEISAGLIDETAPNIVSITPIDKNTVEVRYDEELRRAGTYKIYDDEDEDKDNIVTSNASDFEAGDDVVLIKVETMDSDKIYAFEQVRLAEDRAREPNEATEYSGFSFQGVENDPEVIYFVGADIVNGTTVDIKTSEDIDSGATATITGGNMVVTDTTNVINDDIITFTSAGNHVFAKGVTYTATLVNDGTTITIEFEGLVEVLAVEVDGSEITLDGYEDHDDFEFVVFDSNDTDGNTDEASVDENGDVTTTGISAGSEFKLMIKLGDNVIYTTEVITVPAS